jgi:ribosomal protein S18 acetylase RimI-like enzyme
MTIRKAILSDAERIASYLMLAMEDIIYEFIGQTDPEKARDFLLHFVQSENNQYSYQNCFVLEEDHQVIAAINIYEGAKLEQLRAPISQYIKTKFLKDFNPEDETQAGEYYIDSFGVNPDYQGKGIGAKMLQYIISTFVHQKKQTLGLLVDEKNPNAQRLYLKMGFEPAGEKILVGKRMLHLQLKPNPLLH